MPPESYKAIQLFFSFDADVSSKNLGDLRDPIQRLNSLSEERNAGHVFALKSKTDK